jgi:hypothetical protein
MNFSVNLSAPSGAFSRYQARIVWLAPAMAGLIACGLGLAVPEHLRKAVIRAWREPRVA